MAPPKFAEIPLKDTIASLNVGLALLNDLHDAFGSPFVLAISNTVSSLIVAVQNVKRNKDECVNLLEAVYAPIYAIAKLHLTADTPGTLPPLILRKMGKFVETLHKIHTFVELQQSGNTIKQFFRQMEVNAMLSQCREGLQDAIQAFQIDMDATSLASSIEMHEKMQAMHQELLVLIASVSDGGETETSSITYPRGNLSQNSSNSFSLLPSEPKIFHGRDAELDSIVKILSEDSARVIILGAGGMGKTSLARAALHHRDVVDKYQSARIFVSCDSAANSVDLAALLGAHLGLRPGKDLTKMVVQHFTRGPPTLLVLDNLETPWEPLETRSGIEEFLSLLAGVGHLGLLVTMRGAERPAKTSWSRPFLAPLRPLSGSAARDIFKDIADDMHNPEDVDRLLDLTDNVPLVVDLMAHLVDYEGCHNVLNRWDAEKTSILSQGYDQRSNLDVSIRISLSSPRMTAWPGAIDLLSLLSMLPDGLSNTELLRAALPISDPLGCKTALLATSLAYIDEKKRLKSLVPIREYMLQFHPPSAATLIAPIRKYLFLLLELHLNRMMAHTADPIISNFGNLHSILRDGLQPGKAELAESIKSTILLSRFSRFSGHGRSKLMDLVGAVLRKELEPDYELEVEYITETFASHSHHPVENPEQLIATATSHLANVQDPAVAFRFYFGLAGYQTAQMKDRATIMKYGDKALEAAQDVNARKAKILSVLAQVDYQFGDYASGAARAHLGARYATLAGDPFMEGGVLQSEAMCCTALGDFKSAVVQLEKSIRLMGLCGVPSGVDSSSGSLAEVHIQKSEYAQARSIHEKMLQDNSSHQDSYGYGFACLNLAEIDVCIGAYAEARSNLAKAARIFGAARHTTHLAYCRMIGADLELKEGHTLLAKEQFLDCLHSTWGKDHQVVSFCLERLGDARQWNSTSAFDWAFPWAIMFLIFSRKTQEKLATYKALRVLGDFFLHDGDDGTAEALFGLALDGFTYMDVHRGRGDCMLRLGDLAKGRGNLDGARMWWQQARPLFELSMQRRSLDSVDERFIKRS
ncbi:hypothetical protein FB45DRAFT_235546 [Roridomyces roridus]|uniref:Novel STAND NTPase 1 domain-containing protein n=1 Tax=Roridomyces roridus TaxID=1738132 RepID=A0AAD7BB11_9AGAR|nr:hypothetical protein FB45DRAFT_235546 [Roridomyces roridus]